MGRINERSRHCHGSTFVSKTILVLLFLTQLVRSDNYYDDAPLDDLVFVTCNVCNNDPNAVMTNPNVDVDLGTIIPNSPDFPVGTIFSCGEIFSVGLEVAFTAEECAYLIASTTFQSTCGCTSALPPNTAAPIAPATNAPVAAPVATPTTPAPIAPVATPTTPAPVVIPTTPAPVAIPTTPAPIIPTTAAPGTTPAPTLLIPTVPVSRAPSVRAPENVEYTKPRSNTAPEPTKRPRRTREPTRRPRRTPEPTRRPRRTPEPTNRPQDARQRSSSASSSDVDDLTPTGDLFFNEQAVVSNANSGEYPTLLKALDFSRLYERSATIAKHYSSGSD